MAKIKKTLVLVDKVLGYIEEAFSYLGLILVLMLVAVAFSRYFLRIPTPFEEEISLLLNLWTICLGMSIVLRTGDHINTPIIYDKAVAKIGRGYRVLIYLISATFLALMIYFLYLRFPIITRGVTEYVRLPYATFYYALIVAFSFMLLRYMMKIIMTLMVEIK